MKWCLFLSLLVMAWLVGCQDGQVTITVVPTSTRADSIAAAMPSSTYTATPTLTATASSKGETLDPSRTRLVNVAPATRTPDLNVTPSPRPTNTPTRIPSSLPTRRTITPTPRSVLTSVTYACPDLALTLPDPLPTPNSDVLFTIWPSGDMLSPVYPATPIVIVFAQPMQPENVLVTIEPVTPGDFEWFNEQTLVFRPASGCLEENEDYTVWVRASVESAGGDITLTEAHYGYLTTTWFGDLISFGGGIDIEVAQASADHRLPFSLYRAAPSTLAAKMYKLSQERFFDFAQLERRTDYLSNAYKKTDLPLFRSWEFTVNLPGSPYFEVRDLVLPPDAPAGFYLVELTAATITRQMLIVLTDNRLVVKESPTQIVAWVSDHSATPQVGATVSVFNKSGQLLHQGVTDNSGIYQLDSTTILAGPFFVTAQEGDDTTVTLLTNQWRTNYAGVPWDPVTCEPPRRDWPLYAVHIFTDSLLYHGGETVHFKAFIFANHDSVFTALPENTPVTIYLNGSMPMTLMTDAFSTVTGEYELPAAAEGIYTLELAVGEQTYSQSVTVAPAVTVPYHIAIMTEPIDSNPNQPITVTVAVMDSQEEPVWGTTVSLDLFARGLNNDWYTIRELRQAIWTQPTDESGYASFLIPEHLANELRNGSQLLIQAAAAGNYQTHLLQTTPVQSVTPIPTLQTTLTISVEQRIQYLDKGFTISGMVINREGELLRGREVTLELYKDTNGHYEDLTFSTTLTSDDNGRVAHVLTIGTPGSYVARFTLQDITGVLATSPYIPLYILGAPLDGEPALNIVTEQNSYAPGEVARLYVESRFSGVAWLTIERGTVRRQEMIVLTEPVTVLELPLMSTDVPNIFVTLSTWAYWGNLVTANVELLVTASHPTITIDPNQISYQAGAEASFTVSVTDKNGEPGAAALLSLAFALEPINSNDTSSSLFSLYRPWDNFVYTYDSIWPFRRFQLFYPTGGCYGNDTNQTAPTIFPASTETLWFPNLITDATGVATITFPLPETPGLWRLTVKVITDDLQLNESFVTIEIES